jgi:glycosyltransferase involved in cell wall biosynthesis
MKTISILIAAHEAQEWLGDCLDSIFMQELPPGWNMQVLLGVDGCDKTLAVARTFHYPSLGIIYLAQNHGTYITFNTLMRYAKGELICRFDADDVMNPDYLSAQILAIEAGVDMTMTWSIYVDAKLQPTSFVLAHAVYHPENGLNRRGCEGLVIMRREVWRRLGGYRDWRCGADTDFFRRLRCAGFTHGVIEQFLYLRRTHENSLTAHPDTNFQSPLRLSIQKRGEKYLEQYQTGKRGLKIRPKYAKDHARL